MAEYGGRSPNGISDGLDWVRRDVGGLGLPLLWSPEFVGGRPDCDVWVWALAFVRGATCQYAMINRVGRALSVSIVQSTKHVGEQHVTRVINIPSVYGLANIVPAVVEDSTREGANSASFLKAAGKAPNLCLVLRSTEP
jgi:hypothetical protein